MLGRAAGAIYCVDVFRVLPGKRTSRDKVETTTVYFGASADDALDAALKWERDGFTALAYRQEVTPEGGGCLMWRWDDTTVTERAAGVRRMHLVLGALVFLNVAVFAAKQIPWKA